MSPYLTGVNDWMPLYTFELGLALCCLAMVVSLKPTRALRIAVFEFQDLFTFALLATGLCPAVHCADPRPDSMVAECRLAGLCADWRCR